MEQALQRVMAQHVTSGNYDATNALGVNTMPHGYALMLNCQQTHYYWVKYNGIQSEDCYHKWDAHNTAITHSKQN